ncbi:hypothetical protein WJX72_011981 [[Myrmecia] bisecta]|uniref:Fungal lipase-type domain-containing protein n=1 Tax=[Myrmecia] bisecta TaxID=41462 RepID=A0AAW1Q8A0_9CHLO
MVGSADASTGCVTVGKQLERQPVKGPTANDLVRWIKQLQRFGQTLWGYIRVGGLFSWSPTELSLLLPTVGLLLIPTWVLHGLDYFTRGLQSVANFGVISRAQDLFSVVNYFDYDFHLPANILDAFPAAANTSNTKLRVLAMCAKLAYEEWFYSYVAQDIVSTWNTLSGSMNSALAVASAQLASAATVKWVEGYEFERISYLDNHVRVQHELGTEACIITIGNPIAAVIVSFRGSEPFVQADWFTDYDFGNPVDAPGVGCTHPGFRIALGLQPNLVNALPACRTTWVACPMAGAGVRTIEDAYRTPFDILVQRVLRLQREEAFVTDGARLYMTGHSLGGALALLFAATLRYRAEINPSGPEGQLCMGNTSSKLQFGCVATFGQPRVGDETFRDNILNKHLTVGSELCYYRIVNTIDIVPRVPPSSVAQARYAHGGHLLLYNSFGQLEVSPAVSPVVDTPHIYWWQTWTVGATKLVLGGCRFVAEPCAPGVIKHQRPRRSPPTSPCTSHSAMPRI